MGHHEPVNMQPLVETTNKRVVEALAAHYAQEGGKSYNVTQREVDGKVMYSLRSVLLDYECLKPFQKLKVRFFRPRSISQSENVFPGQLESTSRLGPCVDAKSTAATPAIAVSTPRTLRAARSIPLLSTMPSSDAPFDKQHNNRQRLAPSMTLRRAGSTPMLSAHWAKAEPDAEMLSSTLPPRARSDGPASEQRQRGGTLGRLLGWPSGSLDVQSARLDRNFRPGELQSGSHAPELDLSDLPNGRKPQSSRHPGLA